MHSPLSHAEEFAGGGAFSCRKDLKEDGSRCIMEVPETGKGTPVSEGKGFFPAGRPADRTEAQKRQAAERSGGD